ncbi:hypothetical protein Hanom_Chr04g00319541 [Helianthus anomalus]
MLTLLTLRRANFHIITQTAPLVQQVAHLRIRTPYKVTQRPSLCMLTLSVLLYSYFLFLAKLVPHGQRLTLLGYITRVNTSLDKILRGVTKIKQLPPKFATEKLDSKFINVKQLEILHW